MPSPYTLPALPYAYDALEPILSSEIMQIHHQKHHQGYVTNLNAALEKAEKAQKEGDLTTLISLQGVIRFNGGGHVNHSLFWQNLAPPQKGGGVFTQGPLAQALLQKWGSLENFMEQFQALAAPLQGSGWCWLGIHKETKTLVIHPCANQDPLQATTGLIPLLGVDVWEHAYYLQYKNARVDYLKAIWKVIDWNTVEERFKKCL